MSAELPLLESNIFNFFFFFMFKTLVALSGLEQQIFFQVASVCYASSMIQVWTEFSLLWNYFVILFFEK